MSFHTPVAPVAQNSAASGEIDCCAVNAVSMLLGYPCADTMAEYMLKTLPYTTSTSLL